jgi:hypothetical protein
MTYLIDVATGLSLTQQGEWVTEWQPNVQSIGQIGTGTIDPGVEQMLMSGDIKQDIIEKLGLWGDAKSAFSYGWDAAAFASGAWGYYQGAKILLSEFGAIPKKDPLGDALKKLQETVDELNNKVDKLIQLKYSEQRGMIKAALNGVKTAVTATLNAPGEKELENLRYQLNEAHKIISGGLFDEKESQEWMSYPIEYSTYWACDWLIPTSFWRLRLAPPWDTKGSEGVPVWLTIGQGVNRPDIRDMLGVTLESAVTLITGHTVLDPGFRTTGWYRETFGPFAEVLRKAARQSLASIQITRPIDLASDATHWKYGDLAEWVYPDDPPNENTKYWDPGTWRILADGWPVGAVDTVAGGAIYEEHWKPSEHGWPLLAWAGGVKRTQPLPPEPMLSMALQAIKAANEQAHSAYLELIAQSPAPTLYYLAWVFENMATPPEESETVRFDQPIWSGHRISAGQIDESVGEIPCEPETFTADVQHVDAQALIRCRVQPELYRVGANTINYRYYLEAPSLSSGEELGYPPMGEGQRVELDGESGTVTITVPDFRWNVIKAPLIFAVVNTSEEEPEPLPGQLLGDFPKMVYDEPLDTGKWTIVGPSPLQPTPGSIEATGEYRKLKITYQRENKVGDSPTDPNEIRFTISAEPGSGNAMLWLVVEEPIGNPLKGQPKLLRTGVRLPVVTIEHLWPWSYFIHKKECAEARSKMLELARKQAAVRKIPVPDPNPELDKTFAEYVGRVYKVLKLPVPTAVKREATTRASRSH